MAQYPVLVPPSVTVEAARAPEAVLHAVLWVLPVGAALVVPSLALLFYLFKGRRPSTSA